MVDLTRFNGVCLSPFNLAPPGSNLVSLPELWIRLRADSRLRTTTHHLFYVFEMLAILLGLVSNSWAPFSCLSLARSWNSR